MTAIKDTDTVVAIKTLIQDFFDRINASDPRGLEKLFAPNAILAIVRQDPPRAPPPESAWAALPLPPPAAGPAKQTVADGEDKLSVVLRISIEDFVQMLEDGEKKRKGKPGPVVHEVPDLDATDVRIDDLFGSAWSPFRVTFDGILHHYGTFVYTFGKVGDGASGEKVWRIEGLTQSYRRTTGWEQEHHAQMVKGSL